MKLHIFYDATCGLCRACRDWLTKQPAYVELEFLPLQFASALARFPGLEQLHPEERLLVVNQKGEVWTGVDAWVMCLWALREYRAWSLRLANPLLKPFARRICELVSTNRHLLSRFVFRRTPEHAAEWLNGNLSRCSDSQCGPR